MKAEKIEYYTRNEQVGRMAHLNGLTMDAAGLVAQKYMAQFPAIDTAKIFGTRAERVVSRATTWQRVND